ncbi:DUF6059 family protein [Streptomyces aidingensis]|uniref:Uncharacterized protein n=1 Tax=Streptomyces aidingensis TaxID=910347 RepID=A0A1I1QYR9_9ACTN|nr:hypothetical protein SAMN05421773_11290 [Streptomyces aidingensis]
MAGRKQCDAIQFVRRQPRALAKALAAFGWMWMPRPAEADVPGSLAGPGADDVSGPAGARRLAQTAPHPWPAWADPVAGAWAGRWIFDEPPPGHPERLVPGPLSPLESDLARELKSSPARGRSESRPPGSVR